MKHVFILNPAAGKGRYYKRFLEKLNVYCGDKKLNCIIHITKEPYEAISYCRDIAKSGEPLRFYACGGDGTLFEVVNGVWEYKNAEVAAIPLGSGNDFSRLFGKKRDLLDIEVHINGSPRPFDLIKCGDKIAINQCSMGLDAEVCAKQIQFKKLPFINAEFAYTAALLYCFLRKMKNTFTISLDDSPPIELGVLFALFANSRWYGGGFKGAPLAVPDDGLAEAVIMEKKINRLYLLPLITKYKKGEHLNLDITRYSRVKKMVVKSDKLSALNIDGECDYVYESTFELIEKGIKFVVPSNSAFQ